MLVDHDTLLYENEGLLWPSEVNPAQTIIEAGFCLQNIARCSRGRLSMYLAKNWSF